jgi:L-ribulose-5-phosphate 3-epimerase
MTAESHPRIGFMQGRLSEPVDGKIQCFPWRDWRSEFSLASTHRWRLMEWTLDDERVFENPLMTREGRKEIVALQEEHEVEIPSLTGDFFMQVPFFKAERTARVQLLDTLDRVLESCAALGVHHIVLPLVDNGGLTTPKEREILMTHMDDRVEALRSTGMKILFESDFPPEHLAQLINGLDQAAFGVNYDIGNSAGCGFDFVEEFERYGPRIDNVHVKDRLKGKSTVPLGTGDADLAGCIKALAAANYTGNYILQTARAADGADVEVLNHYRNMVRAVLVETEACT